MTTAAIAPPDVVQQFPAGRRAHAVFTAHQLVKDAALTVGDVSAACPELEKLAGELMTMAQVTEIVAHAILDDDRARSFR